MNKNNVYHWHQLFYYLRSLIQTFKQDLGFESVTEQI